MISPTTLVSLPTTIHRLRVTHTYGWREAEKSKSFTEAIPDEASTHDFTVPTGVSIVDEFVRIEVK